MCLLCQITVRLEQGSLDKAQEGTSILAILDEDWPAFLKEDRCKVREEMNRWRAVLSPEQTRDSHKEFYTTIRQVPFPT